MEKIKNFIMTSLWKKRSRRILTRSHIRLADAKRTIDWNFRGGKRFFELYTPEILSSHKWCFIVCCNNSGSSLLQSILENSAQVSTMPHEGQRYTKTIENAHRRGHERVWIEFINDLRLTEADSLERIPRLVHDWMGVLEHPIKKVIIEKTTANAVRMRWLQKAFPNSYFIGLIRNGYAVTEGIYRKGKKPVSRGAYHWNHVNKIMMEDAKKIKNFFQLKYEDMVENPSETSKKVGEFLNIDSSKVNEAMKGEFSFSTISGQDKQSIRNMNIDSINRLSEDDIKIIDKYADEMLTYFNYKKIIS